MADEGEGQSSGEITPEESPLELLETALSWVEPGEVARVVEMLRDLRDTKRPQSVFKL